MLICRNASRQHGRRRAQTKMCNTKLRCAGPGHCHHDHDYHLRDHCHHCHHDHDHHLRDPYHCYNFLDDCDDCHRGDYKRWC